MMKNYSQTRKSCGLTRLFPEVKHPIQYKVNGFVENNAYKSRQGRKLLEESDDN